MRGARVWAVAFAFAVAAGCGDDSGEPSGGLSLPPPTTTTTDDGGFTDDDGGFTDDDGTPTDDNGVTDDGETPTECSYDGDIEALLECVVTTPVDLADAADDAPASDVDTANPYPYTVTEYLSFIVADVDAMWTRWFEDVGLAEPEVYVAYIGPDNGPGRMACGGGKDVPHDHPNAYYCSIDVIDDADGRRWYGQVLLPITTFQQMWVGNFFGSPSKVLGDFGAALVVAHEFGHHVADEIAQQQTAAGFPTVAVTGVNSELIADCFAGVWMASAYYSGVLEPGDYEEGVAALEAISDTATGGTTHGTADERRQALLTGYNGLPGITSPGDPAACIQTYWY
jgi:uncharacterized protein